MLTLIIDDRERAIFPYLELELGTTNCRIGRIQIGDYNLIDDLGNVIICFERKSLEDFAASLKDGRYQNKQKMIKLRELCGCKLIYIVEGPPNPPAKKRFGRMPYNYIESAMFHLMVRDNINIIETKNIKGTAEKLARFTKSMENLYKKKQIFNIPINDEHKQWNEYIDGLFENIPAPIPTIPDILKTSEKIDDISIVRNLWTCFSGITVINCEPFIEKYSIANIINKNYDINELKNIKYPNGKLYNKRVISSLTRISKDLEIKLVKSLPGISRTSAIYILNNHRLKDLIKLSEADLAKIQITEKTKLGAKKANNYTKLFNLKKNN